METANEPRPPAVRRVQRYKRALCEAEVAAAVKANRTDPAAAEPAAAELAAATAERAEELKSKNLLIEQWDLERINADLSRCGLAGSPTKVFRVQAIVLKKEGYTEIPATEEGARRLIHELVVDRSLG